MSETTLLIAFIAFAFVALIVAVVARNLSVRDVFDDTSVSITESSPSIRDSFPSSRKTSKAPTLSSKTKSSPSLGREKTHKIAKILSVVGAIILFTPTPESFKVFGIGLAFLGSMVAKATAPKQNKATPKESSTAQKIRALASKPEYQGALKILYEDYKKEALVTDEEKNKHALQYLQNKGVPLAEAKQNLMLLRSIVLQKKQ